MFVQIRYLFGGYEGMALPGGISYSDYARRGFFELFFLTGVNIAFILWSVSLFKGRTGAKGGVIQGFQAYLCLLTFVLLASSFYRMTLYSADDGFTRLRLLVYGFLLFEAVGLAITDFYIFKPKFNIIAVYAVIALSYYCVVNVGQLDYWVAKNQVDRYLEKGDPSGISYACSLSADAAPALARLRTHMALSSQFEPELSKDVGNYFERIQLEKEALPQRWQRLRLSDFYPAE
jgi:hypothetical protein